MMEGQQPALELHDTLTWFSQSQLKSVITNGLVPEWFHGIISRKTSEELLMPKPPGYFLIRVSQTRIGYTLSYRAADRCRHFMIDVKGDGQYIIVGENRCHHCLQDLVDFHRRNPIMPFSEVLTIACGQSSKDNSDYAELLFPQRHRNPTTSSLQPSQSHPGSQERLPPALPHRPSTLSNSAPLPPGTQTPRLYPNLEAQFHNVTSQFPAMPVPKLRKAEGPQAQTPPDVPARSFGPLNQNEACMRPVSAPMSSCPVTPNETTFGTNILPTKTQEMKQSVISNLKNLKKKFQKNQSSFQDNAYTEVGAENVYQEILQQHEDAEEEDEAHSYTHSDVTVTDRVLLAEYQPPPPFAPGY